MSFGIYLGGIVLVLGSLILRSRHAPRAHSLDRRRRARVPRLRRAHGGEGNTPAGWRGLSYGALARP